MRRRARHINWYFLGILLLILGLGSGCRSIEDRRKDRVFYTEMWFHLVAPPHSPEIQQMMPIELAGMRLSVVPRPWLTEENLVEAAVVDSPGGGFSLRLAFDDHGRRLIESYTTSHRGRQVAVFARYGVRKHQKTTPLEERWLAAPLITRPVLDGVIVFTPNVTKEELYRIVDGLRKAAELNAKPWVF